MEDDGGQVAGTEPLGETALRKNGGVNVVKRQHWRRTVVGQGEERMEKLRGVMD